MLQVRVQSGSQHPGPASIAKLCPVIEVARLAPHIDHGIDTRAATKHFTAGIANKPAIETGLAFGLVTPIRGKVCDGV